MRSAKVFEQNDELGFRFDHLHAAALRGFDFWNLDELLVFEF